MYSPSETYVSNVVNSTNPRAHYTIEDLAKAKDDLKNQLTSAYAVKYIENYLGLVSQLG